MATAVAGRRLRPRRAVGLIGWAVAFVGAGLVYLFDFDMATFNELDGMYESRRERRLRRTESFWAWLIGA